MLFFQNHKASFIRTVSSLICIWLIVSSFPFQANAADPADALAKDLLTAIGRGQSTADITVQTGHTNLNHVIAEAFTRYPTLCYYYGGYSSMGYSTYTNVTFNLQNTDVPWDQVYVVQSMADLKNALGYCLSRFQPGFHFVTLNGPGFTSANVGDLADEIKTETYLPFMGYHGNTISYTQCNLAPVVAYDVTITYWEGVDRSTLAQWREATEQKALELAGSLFALDMPDYTKELLIHDWLVNNCRYNTQNTADPASHMAYSGLVSGNPVCQGYSEAALLLFQAAGIPAYYVPGDGTNSSGKTESHGWNCVQIQDQWYMLDITWDDPTSQNGTDTLLYNYYNVTSNQLAQDHRWVQADYPDCTATQMNYNTVRSLIDSDTGSYTDYSTRNLMTCDQAASLFGSGLRTCSVPGGTSQEATEPAYTEPATSKDNQPDQPDSDYTTPNYTRPNTPSKNSGDDGISITIPIIAVFIGGILATILKIYKKHNKKEKRQYFDPTRR